MGRCHREGNARTLPTRDLGAVVVLLLSMGLSRNGAEHWAGRTTLRGARAV